MLANAVFDNTAIVTFSLVEPHSVTHLDKDCLLRR
jgi:hypothetical protein